MLRAARKVAVRAACVAGTACAVLATGGPAQASLRACDVDPGLVREMLEWIGEQTAYDVSDALAAPPTIMLCDRGDRIHYEGRSIIVDETIRGLYDLEKRRIVLTEPWDADDPRDQAVILHELIHHVQWTSRDWECHGAPEPEAYRLQEQWLAERGIEADFDWFSILVRARCLRDIHPYEEGPAD